MGACEVNHANCVEQSLTVRTTLTVARFRSVADICIPNVLAILGIILFCAPSLSLIKRGLINATNIITLLTNYSLSAIATSMKVDVNGKYYTFLRTPSLESVLTLHHAPSFLF